MSVRLQDFALKAYLERVDALVASEEADARIFQRIVLSVLGMSGALAAVAVLLLRETGRTRRLLGVDGAARPRRRRSAAGCRPSSTPCRR